MATWPTSLPQRPLRNGFGGSIESGRVSSQPEHGPQQYRRRFTATEDPLNATYRMTFDQWQTVKNFYKNTTANGSLPFDWPEPMTGSTISVTFAEPPSFTTASAPDRLDVTIKLREQPN